MQTNLYRLPSEETLTDAKLNEFIMRHSGECAFRYSRLQEAYETDYPILHEPLKPKWKPDNRIMVNFAKYIVDTMNGFFIGHPIKLLVDGGNEVVEKYVEFWISTTIRTITMLNCPKSAVSLARVMKCIMWMRMGISVLHT